MRVDRERAARALREALRERGVDPASILGEPRVEVIEGVEVDPDALVDLEGYR